MFFIKRVSVLGFIFKFVPSLIIFSKLFKIRITSPVWCEELPIPRGLLKTIYNSEYLCDLLRIIICLDVAIVGRLQVGGVGVACIKGRIPYPLHGLSSGKKLMETLKIYYFYSVDIFSRGRKRRDAPRAYLTSSIKYT